MGELLFKLGVFAVLICVGLFAGGHAERTHLRQLAAAEAALRGIRVTNLRTLPGCRRDSPVTLVTGEVTIGSDYFKTFVSGLRNFFGGEMKNLQRLADRARREALVRMLEEARRAGFDAVGNVRFDSSDIGGNAQGSGKNTLPMVTIIASGTAYRIG